MDTELSNANCSVLVKQGEKEKRRKKKNDPLHNGMGKENDFPAGPLLEKDSALPTSGMPSSGLVEDKVQPCGENSKSRKRKRKKHQASGIHNNQGATSTELQSSVLQANALKVSDNVMQSSADFRQNLEQHKPQPAGEADLLATKKKKKKEKRKKKKKQLAVEESISRGSNTPEKKTNNNSQDENPDTENLEKLPSTTGGQSNILGDTSLAKKLDEHIEVHTHVNACSDSSIFHKGKKVKRLETYQMKQSSSSMLLEGNLDSSNNDVCQELLLCLDGTCIAESLDSKAEPVPLVQAASENLKAEVSVIDPLQRVASLEIEERMEPHNGAEGPSEAVLAEITFVTEAPVNKNSVQPLKVQREDEQISHTREKNEAGSNCTGEASVDPRFDSSQEYTNKRPEEVNRLIEEVAPSELLVSKDIKVDVVIHPGGMPLQNLHTSLEMNGVEHPRKKLLILDLNGLLADIVPYGEYTREPDIFVSGKAVFKRPFVDDFLQFCFEKFAVGVWSSRAKRNVDVVVDFLLGDSKEKLVFCWDQSHCTRTKLSTIENRRKPLVLKELCKLWEKLEPNLPWEKGEYNESNTLLLDDSPYKALRNPANTAIFPYSYEHGDSKDNSLGPGGDLRVYLEGLASADNVQNYVGQNPFGQRAISRSNPSWGYYQRALDAVSH